MTCNCLPQVEGHLHKQSMTDEDELIAAYLDCMAEYQELAQQTNLDWRSGYIDLSRAQLDRPLGRHNYDMNARPRLFIVDNEIKEGDVDSRAMFGGFFAPASLKTAQSSFTSALHGELAKLKLIAQLDQLEAQINQLQAASGTPETDSEPETSQEPAAPATPAKNIDLSYQWAMSP